MYSTPFKLTLAEFIQNVNSVKVQSKKDKRIIALKMLNIYMHFNETCI